MTTQGGSNMLKKFFVFENGTVLSKKSIQVRKSLVSDEKSEICFSFTVEESKCNSFVFQMFQHKDVLCI